MILLLFLLLHFHPLLRCVLCPHQIRPLVYFPGTLAVSHLCVFVRCSPVWHVSGMISSRNSVPASRRSHQTRWDYVTTSYPPVEPPSRHLWLCGVSLSGQSSFLSDSNLHEGQVVHFVHLDISRTLIFTWSIEGLQ